MQPDKILWILGPGQNTNRMKYIVRKINDINPYITKHITFVEVNKLFKFWVKKPKTKETFMLVPDYEDVLYRQLYVHLASARVVVVNDFSVLAAILAPRGGHGSKKKLLTYRGSKYYAPQLFGQNNPPAIVLDDVSKAYMPPGKNPNARLDEQPIACDQFNQFDIEKVIRHYLGTEDKLPDFDTTYNKITCEELGVETTTHPMPLPYHPAVMISREVGGEYIPLYKNINALKDWINRQSVIAMDYETTFNYVSCKGISGIENFDINTIQTYVIPFVNPATVSDANIYMEFPLFMELMQCISNSPAVKVYANGAAYDVNYDLKYRVPPVNDFHDVMHMWHAWRPRLAKSLANIASVLDDDYYYWKDEIKGGEKGKSKSNIPVTKEGMFTYWKYCGRDCQATMVSFIKMLKILNDNPWAMNNYAKEMALMLGPVGKANFMGTRLDTRFLKNMLEGKSSASAKANDDLIIASNGICQTATDAECATWLYDTLGANLVKDKGRLVKTLDSKKLRLVEEQHPIYRKAISYIQAVRKPKTLFNQFRNMKHEHGRLNYTLNAMGTYTGRFSCKASAMWTGYNVQAMHKSVRPMVIADPGKIIIDIDYSQSDSYHFAVACGDKNMLETTFGPKDTHAVHVEMILQVPYDEVMKKKNAPYGTPEWDFVNDSIYGVRQIIKRITHGGNYGMEPPTAYINIGRESLEQAAKLLNITDYGDWDYSQWLKFTERLLEPYFEAYPGQMEFRKRIVQECIDNKGYMECYGGLVVYFAEWDNPKKRDKLMRDLLAFFGQGGTAGMINKAMLNMFYEPYKDDKSFLEYYGIDMMIQGHDSLTYQADIDKVIQNNLVNKLLLNMEIKCKFRNMEYLVPCEANVGPRWASNMVEVFRDDTQQQVTAKILDSIVSDFDIGNYQ